MLSLEKASGKVSHILQSDWRLKMAGAHDFSDLCFARAQTLLPFCESGYLFRLKLDVSLNCNKFLRNKTFYIVVSAQNVCEKFSLAI